VSGPTITEAGADLAEAFGGRVLGPSEAEVLHGSTESRSWDFPALGARVDLHQFADWESAQRHALVVRSAATGSELVEVATNGSILMVVRAAAPTDERRYAIHDLISRFSGDE